MTERVTACDAIAAVEQHLNQVEAVIGGLEGRMHGMDQRLNTVDARLEAMLVEQRAMSALLRESLRQGSRQQSLDSDQTQLDERREQGSPRNGGATWRPGKMDFPRFSGDDLISWVFHAEQYFDCQGIVGDERARHATVYFEGAAVRWFRSLVSQQGRPDWAELTARFGPSAYLDYNVELSSIKQSGTMLEYREHF
uniref:Retrotransposon gag domain-containing protein n=1 Tax=Nymphaea colorata TaxID=210225 RepID=A0A5K0UYS5_9MAGN